MTSERIYDDATETQTPQPAGRPRATLTSRLMMLTRSQSSERSLGDKSSSLHSIGSGGSARLSQLGAWRSTTMALMAARDGAALPPRSDSLCMMSYSSLDDDGEGLSKSFHSAADEDDEGEDWDILSFAAEEEAEDWATRTSSSEGAENAEAAELLCIRGTAWIPPAHGDYSKSGRHLELKIMPCSSMTPRRQGERAAAEQRRQDGSTRRCRSCSTLAPRPRPRSLSRTPSRRRPRRSRRKRVVAGAAS